MREYLDLDLLTLKEISNEAGQPINEEVYLESLQQSKDANCLFEVRKNGELHAYATLRDLGEGKWFVLMFITHPNRRNRHTFKQLFTKIIGHLDSVNATTLVSNVFKANELSVAFHKKLGFTVTREARQGYEFTMALNSAEANKFRQWMLSQSHH